MLRVTGKQVSLTLRGFCQDRIGVGFWGLLVIFICGCGSAGSGYPDVKVTSAIGSAQPCHQCGKKIEVVSDSHLLKTESAQYIVCCETCREKQLQWHAAQFGK